MLSLEAIGNSVASGFLVGGILTLIARGLSIVLGVMRLVNPAHGHLMHCKKSRTNCSTFLIGGTVIVERIFAYPGIGNLAIAVVINR